MDNNVNSYAKESFFDMIRKCLSDVSEVSDDKKCLEIVLNNFQKFSLRKSASLSFGFDEETKKQVLEMLEQKQYDILEYEEGFKTTVINLATKLSKVQQELEEMDEFNFDSVKSYIFTYMKILGDVIAAFQYRRNDLKETKTCINLYTLGILPYTKANMDTCYASIYNPFVLTAICQIIFDILKNYKNINNVPILREMNYEIFINQAKNYFTRYSCDKKTTSCKFSMDINETISSVPMKNLSSLEYISPMLIFEDIATYISEKLQNNDCGEDLEIDIAIVGGISPSTTSSVDANKEDFYELLRALVSWYGRLESKSKLQLTITDIINSKNIPISRHVLEYNFEGNYGKVEIRTTDFQNISWAPVKNLSQLFEEKNMIFFLDVLFYSQIAVKYSAYDLDITQKIWQKNIREYTERCLFESVKEIDWTYFAYYVKGIDYLNFNNITKMLMIPRRIEVMMTPLREISGKWDRVYYYFSSANYELNFMDRKPIENSTNCITNGNEFIEFSHSLKGISLPCSKNDVHLCFRLWSFLKNLPQTYVYSYLKKSIEKKCEMNFETQEDYFEFLRDVFICIDTIDLRNIKVSLNFSNRLECLLINMGISNISLVLDNIHEKAIRFIKEICKKSIFSDSNNLEDVMIKKAFDNCIFENVTDLNALLWRELYHMRFQKGALEKLKVNILEHKYIIMDDDNYSSIKWTNKYHYSNLIEILQYTDKLELGPICAIEASKELFKSTLTEMLENIVKTCENTGFTGTSIYKNGIKMIESGEYKDYK